MKLLRVLSVLSALSAVTLVCSASTDAVEPAQATVTFVRGEGVASVSAGTIYQGTTLNLTNCVCALTNSTSPQLLGGVTVQVAVGNSSTNVKYTATVQASAAGTWHATIAVPSLSTFTLQVKITDGQTNSYIYPSKVMAADTSLF